MVIIEDLNTSSKVATYLREKGKNIIPIVHGTKVPPKGFSLEDYFDKQCDYPITDDMSIAMLHGHVSDTFGIDIDMKNGGGWEDAIHVVAKDIEKILSRTMVVKTPKQGCHFIVKPMGALPPKNAKYFNSDGIEIDIKTQGGYTLLPPSIHPEKQLGRYQFISETLETDPTSWEEFEAHIESKGFFTKESSEERSLSISKYDYNDLIKGKFARGERRVKQNSLYIKKRIMGSSVENARNAIIAVNKKCPEPLDEKEVETNITSAERFYLSRVKDNEKEYGVQKKQNKQEEDKELIDNTALAIRSKYHFVTLRKLEAMLVYDGKIYDDLAAESLIKENTESMIGNCTTHQRMEVLNKIKAQTYVDIERFDDDPKKLTVPNGILDLDTLKLSPHSPKNLSRIMIPVEYHKPEFDIDERTLFEDVEKNLKSTLFWKYLQSSFTINDKLLKEDFEMILEIMSSFFVKRNIDEKAFMFLGSGQNGKSILLEYMSVMMGQKNITNITLQDLEEDRFMRAELHGKLANIYTDLQANELRHTGKIKAITSNEGIQVQKKHQQSFSMYPFAKIIFSCNRFPKVFDQSQGFFRRWIIVKWQRNFENDKEGDPKLKEKLVQNKDEMGKVFSVLVNIARNLNKNSRFTHTKSWKQVQKEWNENADPVDDFAINYIIDSEGNRTKRDTYHFYKQIMFEKGEAVLGIGQFGRAFAEYYDDDVTRIDGKSERVWLNIDFKMPKQVKLKDSE